MAENKPASGSRGPRVRQYVGVAFLAMSCVAAYWITKSRRTVIENAELVPVQTTLDFGEVWEDREFAWKLQLRNKTDRDLQIRNVELSCGCGKVVSTSLQIPAGQIGDINLALDLSHAFAAPIPPKIGVFEVQAAIFLEDSAAPPCVATLRGKVKRALALSESVIDFGEEYIRGETPPRRSITVRPQLPLVGLLAKHRHDWISVETRRVQSSPDYFEAVVSPSAKLAAGPFECDLQLIPLQRKGKCLPSRSLTVRGRVVEPVEVVPPIIIVTPGASGSTQQETLVLISRTGDDVSVARVSCTSPHLTVARRADCEIGVRIDHAIIKEPAQIILVVSHRSQTLELRVPVLPSKRLFAH